VLSLRPGQRRHVRRRAERLAVCRPKHTAAAIERGSEQRLCLLVVALVPVHLAKVVLRVQPIAVVARQRALLQRERAFEMPLRLGIETERLVGVGDRLPDGRLDQRLRVEAVVDAHRRAIESGPYLEIRVRLRVRPDLRGHARLRQQVALQELVDRSCRCGLRVGPLPLDDGDVPLLRGHPLRRNRHVALLRGHTLGRCREAVR
jgi:hypothetical protein